MSRDNNRGDTGKRRGDYRKLVIGFILTTVVGGGLGYGFQELSLRNQRQLAARESERKMATEIFDDISRLMDRRLYRVRLVMSSLSGIRDDEQVDSRWADYIDAVTAWNDCLNRNKVLIGQYFGEDMKNAFYDTVHLDGFREVHGSLRKIKTRVNLNPQWDSLDSQVDTLNNKICELNAEMIRAIQDGKVGRFGPRPKLDSIEAESGKTP